jgi:hypothetical protein
MVLGVILAQKAVKSAGNLAANWARLVSFSRRYRGFNKRVQLASSWHWNESLVYFLRVI